MKEFSRLFENEYVCMRVYLFCTQWYYMDYIVFYFSLSIGIVRPLPKIKSLSIELYSPLRDISTEDNGLLK
jgi:hypothetical protein